MGSTSTHRDVGMSDRQFFEREFPTMLGVYGRIVACATMRTTGGEWHRVFYAAVRNNADAPHAPGETWALVVLMHWNRNSRAYNFTYKDLCDSMGPAEDEAPAAVLDALSPTDSEYANEWRARCRANLERKAARPKVRPGDRVRFEQVLRFGNGVERRDFEFVRRSTFRHAGGLYRIPNWRDRPYEVASA